VPPRAELLAEIKLGQAESNPLLLQGWGPPEGAHRWSVGPESRLRLPVQSLGPDCVLVVHVVPWCDPKTLPGQTVMLALNGRLLASVQFNDNRVLGWFLPAEACEGPEAILSFTHLSCRVPRPFTGLDARGLPLGLMVLSVRVFRLHGERRAPRAREKMPGSFHDGSLPRAVLQETGLDLENLALRFEGLGQDCEFGLIQRACGAEPISLLRFSGMITTHLVDAIMAQFAGIGTPETTDVYVARQPVYEYRVHETRYHLWYGTEISPDAVPRETVVRAQSRRLAFLQRKFAEDLGAGTKIFVVSRGQTLTEAEALALFCALNLHGPNTLLWTVHGDPDLTGQVDALMPGFLRGHLGAVNARNHATLDAWVSVLANACLLVGTASKEDVLF